MYICHEVVKTGPNIARLSAFYMFHYALVIIS